MTESQRLAIKGRDMADLAAQIRAVPARLRELVDDLTEQELEAHPIAGKWSMRTCAEHVVLVSLGWTNILYEAIGSVHDNPRSRDLAWAKPLEEKARRGIGEAMEVHLAHNNSVADYLLSLPPEDWTREFARVQWLPCEFEIRDHLHWGLVGHFDHHLPYLLEKRAAMGK